MPEQIRDKTLHLPLLHIDGFHGIGLLDIDLLGRVVSRTAKMVAAAVLLCVFFASGCGSGGTTSEQDGDPDGNGQATATDTGEVSSESSSQDGTVPDSTDDAKPDDSTIATPPDNGASLTDTSQTSGTDSSSSSFVSVSVGEAHSCGLRIDKTITCWGNNLSGQADNPEGTFAALSAGKDYSCGLHTDSTIRCWGGSYSQKPERNRDGFTYQTSNTGNTATTIVEGNFKAVAADGNGLRTCAVRTDGTTTCWDNTTLTQADTPNGTFNTVHAGTYVCDTNVAGCRELITVFNTVHVDTYVCGLHTDSTIHCWKYRENGGLEVLTSPEGEFKTLSTGYEYACAMHTDNTIRCWKPTNPQQAVHTPAGQFTAVSIAAYSSCVFADIFDCWNVWYKDYEAPITCSYTDPVVTTCSNASGDLDPPVNIAACGVQDDSTVECWNENGELPNTPKGEFTSLSVNRDHACGVQTGGTINCWGNNLSGQANVPSGKFTTITPRNLCGIQTSGTIRCWGEGFDVRADGQPTWPTETFTDFKLGCGILTTGSIACGGLLSDPNSSTYNYQRWNSSESDKFVDLLSFDGGRCGLHQNSTVKCWDLYDLYDLDDGLEEHDYARYGQFTTVSAGPDLVCGVRADGTVKCWRHGGDELDIFMFSGPFNSVTVGLDGVCGLRTDNTVECREEYGDSYHTPSGTFTSISTNSAIGIYDDFYSLFCGLQTNGSIKCWDNHSEWETPLQTEGPFTAFSVGIEVICGLHENGNIKCWFSTNGLLHEPEGQFTAVNASGHACGLHTNGDITCWAPNYWFSNEDADPPYIASFAEIRA